MSNIATKLTYLNGTKQAIKQTINEDFEVIDNNTTFREYADEISSNNAKYKDLIPKETKNATNTLDISNSSGLDKALVTQYGNTYQEEEPTPDTPQEIVNISGKSTLKDVRKNLFDGVLELGNFNTNTGEKVQNNNYIINTNPIPVEELTNYKISSNGTGIGVYIFEYKEDLTYNLSSRKTINADSYLTTNSGTKYINFRTIDVNTNLQEKIQVEKSSTASTYEAYKEQSFGLDLKSKNLFDKNNASIFQGYLDNNSVISRSDAATTIYIPCKPNTTYTVQKTIGTNNRFCVFTTTDVPVGGNSALNYVGTRVGADNNTNYTITTPSQANYLCAFVGVETTTPTISEIIASIQIEENPTPTEYEPYYNINLCEIDNYKDRIYPLNGKWYLEKKIGKVVLNGTQTLFKVTTGTTGYYRFNVDIGENIFTTDSTTTVAPIYCNRLVGVTRGNTYNRIEGIAPTTTSYSYNTFDLYIEAISQMTVEQANTWFSNNPTIVYYPYKQPTTEEITENNYPTLYNQLNNIKLYEGVNHLTFTNESGLDVEFDIEYYKDWKLD